MGTPSQQSRALSDQGTTRLLGVPEVAQRLDVSRPSVYRLIYAGHLFSVKVGSRRLIPDVALQDYIARLIKDAS